MAKLVSMKTTIITPVHIGNGEIHKTFEYSLNNNALSCYKIEDLLSKVPNDKLLDKNFLRNISTIKKGQSTKEVLFRELNKYINNKDLKPIYTLECLVSDLGTRDVSEQIKSLNKPYIPGSSLKGAIFNAILYDIVKNNFNKIFTNGNINKLSSKFINFDNIIMILYPMLNENELKEFIKQMRSCLICRDIFFEKMIFLKTNDDKKIDSNDPVPTNSVECIKDGQIIKDKIFRLDDKKIDKLKGMYLKQIDNDINLIKIYNNLLSYLSYNKLIKVMNQYFNDNISEEIDNDDKIQFYEDMNVYNQIKELRDYKHKYDFYVRIGRNTNYFFKSISYIAKKYNPDFYKKNFKIFDPSTRKTKADPDTMPITRTIYEDDMNQYYPGVIKIEYIIKD